MDNFKKEESCDKSIKQAVPALSETLSEQSVINNNNESSIHSMPTFFYQKLLLLNKRDKELLEKLNKNKELKDKIVQLSGLFEKETDDTSLDYKAIDKVIEALKSWASKFYKE